MALPLPSSDDDDATASPAVSADAHGAGSSSDDVDRTPLVDHHVFYDLEDQLDSRDAARAFVRDYVTVWDERDLRLSSAIARKNQAASVDAVLSLKIASTMVGATKLVAMATELEQLLRDGRLEEAEAVLPRLQQCGLRTMRELTLTHLSNG